MKKGKYFVAKRAIIYEVIAFIFLDVFVWLDEVLDLPHILWGAKATMINWRESLFESIIITVTGIIIISFTNKLFRRMKLLEGIIPICASCKQIRDNNDNWCQIESYIRDRTETEFTHGICPVCAVKLYPEFQDDKIE